MNMVFGRIREPPRRPSTADSGGSSDGSINSQNDHDSRQQSPGEGVPQAGASQEIFMSQVPSGHRLATSNHMSSVDRGPSAASTRLLANLKRSGTTEITSISNELAVRRPENAKYGSEDMPWLRLSEREITELRGELKTTAECQPSDDLINHELVQRGRGLEAHKTARARAEAEGAEFVDCDDIENTSDARVPNARNVDKEVNEVNDPEDGVPAKERQANFAVEERSAQRASSTNGQKEGFPRASPTETPAGRLFRDGTDREAELPKTPPQPAAARERQLRDNHPVPAETSSDHTATNNWTFPSAPSQAEISAKSVAKMQSTEADKRLGEDNVEQEPATRQRKESIKESVKTKATRPPRAGNTTDQSDANKSFDPWYDLKTIRNRDVKIPRNQHKLLEDHRQWMPPLPGKSDPRGHVPPELLAEWNHIVLERSRRANGEQGSKSPTSQAPDSRESPPNLSDPTSEAGSDVGTPVSHWSGSPDRSHPRRELPADSPVLERRRARKSDSPRQREDVESGDYLHENADIAIYVSNEFSNEQDQVSTSERHKDRQVTVQHSSQIDGKPTNTNIPEPIPGNRIEEREDDSDNESDESAMDAAVPCPLGDSSQPELSVDQTDHEPTSSGQSLPYRAVHEHVQVVETPAADLTRRRSDRPTHDQSGNSQQESSQASISSSQSRIFNTYASHGTSMRSPSQEPYFSSQTNGDNESTGIDIMSAQTSPGNWPTQSTPNSHSGFVPNSSGPERSEPSIPVDSSTKTEGNLELRIEAEKARKPWDNDRRLALNWMELEKIIGSDRVKVLQSGAWGYSYTTQLRKLFKHGVDQGVRKLTQAVVSRLRNVRSSVPAFRGIRLGDAWEAEKMSGEDIPESELAELGLMRGPGGLPVRKQEVETDAQADTKLEDYEGGNDGKARGEVRERRQDEGEPRTTESDEQKANRTALFPSNDESLSPSVPSSAWDASTGGTFENNMVPNLKRLASVFETDEPSPSKRQRTEPIGNRNVGGFRTKGTKGSTSNIMSRRESYLSSTANRAEAMRAYEKFQTDYPIYSGQFSHFIELCSKLQALRDKGHLKRSFLWDDFIIMHLDQYPSYLQLCHEMDAKSMDYEEYFSTHFSKPTYKKRSLTANGIEVSAAHWLATSQRSVTASPSISRGGTNGSLATSFMNRLSEFHVHSFGPKTQDYTDIESDRLSGTASLPPTPLKKPQRNTPILAQGPTVDKSQWSRQTSRQPSRRPSRQPSTDRGDKPTAVVTTEPAHDEPVTHEPSAQEPAVDASLAEDLMDYDSAMDEPDASRQLLMENAQALSAQQTAPDVAMTESDTVDKPGANEPVEIGPTPEPSLLAATATENGVEPSIPESENDDDNPSAQEQEIYNEMEETHSTASIELGDEDPSTISQEPRSDAREPETSSECKSVNEGWFSSLRHIRPPTGPVWSDDPNTPFKLWARADQNVKIEVSRRNGRYRDVDNKGVIQRSTTLRSGP